MWPARPSPLTDESLSSWLIRIANSQGLNVVEFVKAAWPGRPLLARDLDKFAPQDVVDRLASGVGVTSELAEGTTLRCFEGVLFERLVASGPSPWVLRAGVYNRVRYGHGQQWCPHCLAEDPIPYYRLPWRLSFSSTCGRHGVILADRCGDCGAPANLFKVDGLSCHVCGTDRRVGGAVIASSRTLQLEDRARRMLYARELPWTETEASHPLAYFGLLRAVIGNLVRGPAAGRLRAATAKRFGGDPTPPTFPHVGRTFESLAVEDRSRVLELAAPLLEQWPWKFLAACAEAEVTQAHLYLFRRPADTPYMFAAVTRDFLAREPARGPVWLGELSFHGRPTRSAARRRALRQALSAG